jgi:transposase-like protein
MSPASVSMFTARCPHCRSVDFRSVGVRNALEGVLHWLLQPYRCALCGKHFFLFRWLVPVGEAA